MTLLQFITQLTDLGFAVRFRKEKGEMKIKIIKGEERYIYVGAIDDAMLEIIYNAMRLQQESH